MGCYVRSINATFSLKYLSDDHAHMLWNMCRTSCLVEIYGITNKAVISSSENLYTFMLCIVSLAVSIRQTH